MRWIAAMTMAVVGVAGCSSVLGDSPADDTGEARPDASAPTADASPTDDPTPALFTPSNVPVDTFASGSDALVLVASDSPVVIDTDTGRILSRGQTDIRPDGVTYQRLSQGGAAPELGVFAATEISIPAGVIVEVHGAASLVLVASGAIRIGGAIDASGGLGDLIVSGPGGQSGGIAAAVSGRGPGGGPGVANDLDVGGAGAGHVGLGGKGGDRGNNPGPGGGIVYGTTTLVPLIGGSGGGFGGGTAGGADGGRGGGGGGAVQLTALRLVEIAATGVINVGGGGGEGGINGDCGGGGGSGGAVLIESPVVDVRGIIAANGGGGGAGANDVLRGAPGQAGTAGLGPAAGGASTGDGGAGGSGGASGQAAGGPGQSADLEVINYGGGGGGAAGRIHLRTDDLAATGAILSPVEGLDTAPL